MSVKRSDIKYTGSAFIKYQLWFHALSQAFLVGIYSPVILDLTKTINFTEGWHPLVDHLKGKKLRILSSRRILALYSHIIYDGSSRGPLPEKKKIHKDMIGIKPCNHLKQKLVTWLIKKASIWFFLFFFFLCFAHLDNPNVRTRQSKLYKFFRGRGSWLRRTGRGCNYVTNEFFLVFFFS